MSDIVLTWPKKRSLASYLAELSQAHQDGLLINFRVASKPDVQSGERCYMVHNGKIRGFNQVVTVEYKDNVLDPITGETMTPGFYVVRDPHWHGASGMTITGFRGFRYFDRIDKKNAHEVLVEARAYIEDGTRWITQVMFRNINGEMVESPLRAYLVCAIGSIYKVCNSKSSPSAEAARAYLEGCAKTVGSTPAMINDHEGHQAVLNLYDCAIERSQP